MANETNETQTPTDRWTVSMDGERYRDQFNSREAAIESGREEAKGHHATFWIGVIVDPMDRLRIHAGSVIEQLQCDAYDEAGDVAERWLTNATKDDEADLQDRLDAALAGWIRERCLSPDFDMVDHMEEIAVAPPGPANA